MMKKKQAVSKPATASPELVTPLFTSSMPESASETSSVRRRLVLALVFFLSFAAGVAVCDVLHRFKHVREVVHAGDSTAQLRAAVAANRSLRQELHRLEAVQVRLQAVVAALVLVLIGGLLFSTDWLSKKSKNPQPTTLSTTDPAVEKNPPVQPSPKSGSDNDDANGFVSIEKLQILHVRAHDWA